MGGGIGGSSASLALLHRGFDVTIYEQAPAFGEVGAGVSLYENALKLLFRIGLEDALKVDGVDTRHWHMMDPVGETLNKLESTQSCFNFHRAELLKVLADRLPEGAVCYDHACSAIDESGEQVELVFANGERATADLVVGADGINSVVRGVLGARRSPTSSGMMAYRGLVPVSKLPWAQGQPAFRYWIGPEKHFLTYPVSRNKLLNVVAFVPTVDPDAAESWTAPGDVNVMRSLFDGWADQVVQIVDGMDETFISALFDHDPLSKWSGSRITLLGDAAHAMLPHMGQGACQSIEDGFALAQLLDGSDAGQLPKRLAQYETLRLDRTRRVQNMARANGRLFRASDSEEQREGIQASRADDRTWLYGYDAEAEAAAVL